MASRTRPGDDAEQTAPGVDFEPRWPMRLALVAAIVLYAFLPDQVLLGPRLIVPVVEGVLFAVLWALAPRRHHSALPHVRALALVLVALISLVNIVNLGFLVRELLQGSGTTGKTLILGAIDIWLTNVIAFGFWYWEMDDGGPVARIRGAGRRSHDFLFPQQANPQVATALLRLPVHQFHQRDRLQPHRHHAPVQGRQRADDGAVRGRPGHHLPAGGAGGQHPQLRSDRRIAAQRCGVGAGVGVGSGARPSCA